LSIDTAQSTPAATVIAPAAVAPSHDETPAVAFSETMPPGLAAAAHSADHAIPLLLALLLDASPDVRDKQEARVTESLGEPALADANAFTPQLAQLNPMLRLPLAELIFPTLRLRPRPELTSTIACVDSLVRADGKVGLFEYCLGCLLHRHLAESLDPSTNWRAGRSKLIDVQDEIASLLSLIAQNGAGSAADAERAYAAGMHSILSDTNIPYAPPPEGFVALDQSWTALNALESIGKTILVEGMTATIGPDVKPTVAQSQLLRTVCAVLDCPLPEMLRAA